LRRLAAYVPDTDPYVVGVKRSMSNAYIAAARKSRDAKSLSEAERFLDRAAEFTPTHPDLATERKSLLDARAMQGRAAQQAKLAADTDALKQRLRDQAKADDIEFLATLRALRQTLSADDAFIRTEAPFLIAESYMRLAAKAARRGSFEEAVTLLDRGLENAQGLVKLRDMRAVYANLLALSQQINSGTTLSVRDSRASLDALAKVDPALHADVVKRFQNSLDARIRAESSRNPTLAASFESAGQQIFPARAAAVRPTPASGAGSQANATKAPAPGPVPTTAAPQTPPAAAQGTPATTIDSPSPTAPAQGAAAAGAKPCRPELQKLGKNARAVCFDSIAGTRGPDIVVIPAGGPFPSPVGVMRYEVTNEDYNFYCSTTQRCKANSEPARLPIVTIPVAEAERYAAWLTEGSGKVYRLPTDTEWTYIASELPDRSEFNCTVEVGGQKIKGFGLVVRNAGDPSNWGVFNIVGNAQEWARAPGGWVARGGAFSDNMSTCSPQLGRVHNGAPDGRTGFRLIREL
jgi:hypothetical protein